eukprot:4126777-Alexandrium_andersonii.AAC.1
MPPRKHSKHAPLVLSPCLLPFAWLPQALSVRCGSLEIRCSIGTMRRTMEPMAHGLPWPIAGKGARVQTVQIRTGMK